jgi:hypothetical protein
MNIYLVNITLLTVIALFIRFRGNDLFRNNANRGAVWFCSLAALFWIVISGFRHEYVGSDTVAYHEAYTRTFYASWSSLFQQFIDIYINHLPGKDAGYALFEKLTQVFIYNYQFYLVLIAIIFTIPFARFIYRYSADVYISFLTYSVLFFSFFSITGHRQTIATAIVVFLGYQLILKRQLFWLITVSLIAASIHKSALLILPFYCIYNFPVKRLHIAIILFIFVPLLLVFAAPYSQLFKTFIGYDEYGINSAAGTAPFTTVMVVIGLIVLWRFPNMLERNEQSTHFINAYLISMLLVPLTFVNPSAMRAVQYYSIFIVLLIPEIVKTFNRKEAVLVYLVISVLMVVLFVTRSGSGGGYAFFWSI